MQLNNLKYCVYIDVLGYKDLVFNEDISVNKRIRLLESIYINLATQFMLISCDINKTENDKIFIRSFSDCFYLDCDRIEPLLNAISRIYNYAFNFYRNFSPFDEKTPFLRCGIVKDWIVRFKDIGAMLRNSVEENTVGLGIARAYCTSEKSNISGMRVIISPEVIKDLDLLENSGKTFDYFLVKKVENNIDGYHYVRKIITDREGNPTNLYELLWTGDYLDHIYDFIEILQNLSKSFPKKHYHHFIETANTIRFGLLVCNNQKKFNPNRYNKNLALIESIISSVA